MLRSLLLLLALSTPWFGSTANAQSISAAPPPDALVDVAVRPPPADWTTVHGSFVAVHGLPEHHNTLLRVARHASKAVIALSDQLGVPIGSTIEIFVAPSEESFRSIQPGRAPTWADATAYPRLGAIYLRAPGVRGGLARPIEQVVDHELVHVLLGRAFAPQQPPHWLQEGVAQVVAGESGPETTQILNRGLLGPGLIHLDTLAAGFPSDPMRARLAYAQSADFIGWLGVEHPEALEVLIDELSTGSTIEAAMRRATGYSLEEIDSTWRSRLENNVPLTLQPLTTEGALWGFGAVMLVGAGVLRRRRFHQRLAEMEAEERLVDELLADLRRVAVH